jgi:hypothetical protein
MPALLSLALISNPDKTASVLHKRIVEKNPTAIGSLDGMNRNFDVSDAGASDAL